MSIRLGSEVEYSCTLSVSEKERIEKVSAIADAATDVAAWNWGTSVTEAYHNSRMYSMDRLRKLIGTPKCLHCGEPVALWEQNSDRQPMHIECGILASGKPSAAPPV